MNIRGAKTVSLITETNGSDGNDHAVWADARLVHEVGYPELEQVLKEYEELAKKQETENSYTEDSWNAYKELIDAATKLLDNPDATAEEIATAVINIQKAKECLVEKAGWYQTENGWSTTKADRRQLDGKKFPENGIILMKKPLWKRAGHL